MKIRTTILALILSTGCSYTIVPEPTSTDTPDSGTTSCGRDGERFAACDYTRCSDGSTTVSARQTCVASRLICLPVAINCPIVREDAGTIPDSEPVDAGTPTETEALSIRYNGPAGGVLYTNRIGTVLQSETFGASRDLETREFNYRIEVLNAEGALSDASGNAVFRNIRIINHDTRDLVMGPINPTMEPNARVLNLRFTGSSYLNTGYQARLDLVADLPIVASTSPLLGTRFRVIAGGDGHFFTSTAVRSVRDGAYVPPSAISGNVVIAGNEFVLRQAGLSVDLMTDPRSQVVAINTPNVASVGISMTANPGSNLLTRRVRLSCVGDTGGGFRSTECHNVINSCSLWASDGTQISRHDRTPDVVNGIMDFSELSFAIPGGLTQVLIARCNMTSVVGASGYRFALGIASDTDVEAVDVTNVNPGVVVQAPMRQQLGTPTVIQTVVDRGILHVYQGLTPITRIIDNAGTDEWITVARYSLASAVEESLVNRTSVHWTGPTDCIDTIALASNRVIHGQNYPQRGTHDLDIVTETPDPTHRGTIRALPTGSNLEIWVRFNRVRPMVPGETDACLTNSTLTFELSRGRFDGEWGNEYRVPSFGINMRAIGAHSGRLIVANDPASMGDTFILR